jgi:hypothetical protein
MVELFIFLCVTFAPSRLCGSSFSRRGHCERLNDLLISGNPARCSRSPCSSSGCSARRIMRGSAMPPCRPSPGDQDFAAHPRSSRPAPCRRPERPRQSPQRQAVSINRQSRRTRKPHQAAPLPAPPRRCCVGTHSHVELRVGHARILDPACPTPGRSHARNAGKPHAIRKLARHMPQVIKRSANRRARRKST